MTLGPGERCIDGILMYSSAWLDEVAQPFHGAAERMEALVRRLNGLNDADDDSELEELIEERARIASIGAINEDARKRQAEALERYDRVIEQARKVRGQ